MTIRPSIVFLLAVAAGACSKPVDEPTSDFKPAQGTPPVPAPTKLEIEDLSPGAGRAAATGTPCTCSTRAR